MSELDKAADAMASKAGEDDLAKIQAVHAAYKSMQEQLGRVVVGQAHVIDEVLMAIFSRGHALLVGAPGLAKTLLVSTVSKVLNLSFKRIQFTPDLMPSDITGGEVLDEDPATGRRQFRFVKGPVFTNMLLADEINRTPPTVTACSCIASSKAACVFGGVRLISSASSMFVKTGPWTKRN